MMITKVEPQEKSKNSNNQPFLVIAIVLTTVQIIFLLWRFSSWFYDDPFITYRYAWNLIHGLGFVYNPGERVLSTTSPFFTLLLAGFGTFWPNLPKLATIIGCLSAGLSGLIFLDLTRQWNLAIVGWVGLLLIPTFPLIASTISSETPLYIALILGTVDCYIRHRYYLLAIFAAILVLVRPDGILLPLLLAVHFLLEKKKHIPWVPVGIFIAINSLWFGYAWLYFGSPFPVTLMTKQQQGVMSISQHFAPGFLTIATFYTQHWYYVIEALLALIGIGWLIIRRHGSLILVIWTLLYFLTYTLLGVTRYFWYYAPLVPGFILMVGAGFKPIYNLVTHIKWHRFQFFRLESVLYIVLAIFCIFQVIDTYHMSQAPDDRFYLYHSVGGWLNENTKETDQIGTLETGIIGYFANRPMIDFAGLLQPDVAKQMRPDSTYEDIARWAINTYHPAYIALNPPGFPELMTDYVNKQCYLVKYFNAQDYQSTRDMAIYHCE
jgi:nitrogen fixation-related uncharacterized protein